LQIESQVAAVTKKVINTPSKAPGADETWPQETLETVAAGWTPVKTLEVRRKRPCWMMCLCIPFPARALSCALLAPTRQSYRRTDLAVQHGCQQRFCEEQEVDTENCVEEDVPMDSEEHEEEITPEPRALPSSVCAQVCIWLHSFHPHHVRTYVHVNLYR
jgi:hypothetical protein